MKTSCRLTASFVALAALIGPAICDPAPAYRVDAPLAHDNLSVYFVRGNGGGAAPLTLDQAVSSGQAKVGWNDGAAFTVENFSDRSIFVPFGTLLTGGLQDQVTSVSLLVPPHSGPMSLATFCVDPFRSTARDNEDPTAFTPTDTMFPNRIAKLVMLAAAPDLHAVGNMRQAGVWWSIDSTRAALSRALGVAVEPPYQPHWQSTGFQDHIANPVLAARQSPWTTSLPLALANPVLRQAEQTYVDAFADASAEDVTGAVFAVNGNIEDAEIYQSHALFAAMWPKLLRAQAIAALAAGSENAQAVPSAEAVGAFLAAAEAGTARESASGTVLRDSEAAVFAETRARNGAWINRSFVATAIAPYAAASPEAALLAMLKAGEVGGRSVKALRNRDQVVLQRTDAGAGWSATIQTPTEDVLWQLQELAEASFRAHGGRTGTGASLGSAVFSLAFFAMLFWLLMPRRRRVVIARAGHARIAIPDRHPAVAWRIAHAPRREPVRRAVVTMKAFAAILAASFERLLLSARGLLVLAKRFASAAWPRDGLAGAIACHLGPAWPGNFGAPTRPLRVATRK